jgi:oligopeptide transport system substrate-binding protein
MKRYRAILGLGMVGLLALAGCRDRETLVERARAENMVLLGNGAEPADLDPQIITGVPEARIVQGLFEGLVRYDPATLDPLPGVAERWELAEDKVTYTFYLRAEAMWSDGVPVTAHDFHAAFERILLPEVGSENAESLFYIAGAAAFKNGETTDFSTVGVRVIDERTLEVRLAQPTSFFLRLLSSRSYFPMPRHVLTRFDAMRRQGTAWTREGNLVGNGPYVLAQWRRDQFIELVKSETYWDRARVAVDRVRFLPIENDSAEEASYRAGQLHKTSGVPVQRIETWRRENPAELRTAPYSGTYYYVFNVTRPPLDDARVRRALALAINRAAITGDITRGGEQVAPRFMPDGVAGYVSPVAGVELDLAEARRLLAEAGYPGGAGFPVVTLLFNTAENHRLIAEAVQQMWRRDLGIDVRMENQEWKVYLSNMHLGNFDICRAGYIVAPDDPTVFLEAFTTGHGFNNSKYSDPEYDALFARSRAEADEATRAALFARMEETIDAAMPVAPVYHYTNSYLIRPELLNWTDNLLGEYPLREMALAP